MWEDIQQSWLGQLSSKDGDKLEGVCLQDGLLVASWLQLRNHLQLCANGNQSLAKLSDY